MIRLFRLKCSGCGHGWIATARCLYAPCVWCGSEMVDGKRRVRGLRGEVCGCGEAMPLEAECCGFCVEQARAA